MVRFGGERLLSVRREPAAGATDAASEVSWLLSGGAPSTTAAPRALHSATASTPPPA
jgi:hypothetical protein